LRRRWHDLRVIYGLGDSLDSAVLRWTSASVELSGGALDARHAFVCSAVADATSVLAPGAALVMVGTSGPTIDPPISLKALFGIEDTNAVCARTLHQVDGHSLAFLLGYAHRPLLHQNHVVSYT